MDNLNIYLDAKELPRYWYNVLPDLPSPLSPPLHPVTKKPISLDDVKPIFPVSLIEQEVSNTKEISIPEEVLEKYLLWRPTPLRRARNLEKFLDTPAHIYFKDESVSPPGSHKPNTAIPQAYYNKLEKTKKICTETGAGQWGSALAFACSQFGLECEVFMVRVSYNQKPYRKVMMQTWGARCVPSPSELTKVGREILAKDPDSPGSLGIAIGEAIERALEDESTKYALGSVLNHVVLHQTVIGLETKKQLELIGEKPDVIIGCVGGGSNFAGMALPFVRDKINGEEIDIYAVEPTSCPTITRGEYLYDFGDIAKSTPLLPMHTLGHSFIPPPVHAGGLRYHGMAPIVSKLVKENLITPISVFQLDTFEAGITWAKQQGFIPAPETTHAIYYAIKEAIKAKEEGKEKTIVFSYSGHGLVDMAAYEAYLSGQLQDYSLSEEDIKKALEELKDLPRP